MIALSSGSLHTYGLSRIFALAAQVGYDGIEIMIDRPNDNRNPRYLRALSDEYHLPIVALHNPFVHSIPDWPDDPLGRLERTLPLAQALGVPIVVTHLPINTHALSYQWHGGRRHVLRLPIPRRGPYYELLRDTERLARMEEDAGVCIAVENMPARRHWGRAFSVHWFNHPDVVVRFPHLTLDTTHIGTWGMDLLAVWDQVRERVAHVHLSNFDGREHRLPADGQLPLDALLRRMAGDGYAGTVSVECGPPAFEAEDEAACLANLERTLAFCREHHRV